MYATRSDGEEPQKCGEGSQRPPFCRVSQLLRKSAELLRRLTPPAVARSNRPHAPALGRGGRGGASQGGTGWALGGEGREVVTRTWGLGAANRGSAAGGTQLAPPGSGTDLLCSTLILTLYNSQST